jgi:hypothetical protein
MWELIQPIKEYAARLVAEAEKASGEAHMAFNSVVNIRATDERLLDALKGLHAEPRNGEGRQVGFRPHGHLCWMGACCLSHVQCAY